MNSKTLDAYLHIAGGLYPSLGWIGEHVERQSPFDPENRCDLFVVHQPLPNVEAAVGGMRFNLKGHEAWFLIKPSEDLIPGESSFPPGSLIDTNFGQTMFISSIKRKLQKTVELIRNPTELAEAIKFKTALRNLALLETRR